MRFLAYRALLPEWRVPAVSEENRVQSSSTSLRRDAQPIEVALAGADQMVAQSDIAQSEIAGKIVNPSPAPATSHPACGFPALGAPVCFVSRVMSPIVLGLLSHLTIE